MTQDISVSDSLWSWYKCSYSLLQGNIKPFSEAKFFFVTHSHQHSLFLFEDRDSLHLVFALRWVELLAFLIPREMGENKISQNILIIFRRNILCHLLYSHELYIEIYTPWMVPDSSSGILLLAWLSLFFSLEAPLKDNLCPTYTSRVLLHCQFSCKVF